MEVVAGELRELADQAAADEAMNVRGEIKRHTEQFLSFWHVLDEAPFNLSYYKRFNKVDGAFRNDEKTRHDPAADWAPREFPTDDPSIMMVNVNEGFGIKKSAFEGNKKVVIGSTTHLDCTSYILLGIDDKGQKVLVHGHFYHMRHYKKGTIDDNLIYFIKEKADGLKDVKVVLSPQGVKNRKEAERVKLGLGQEFKNVLVFFRRERLSAVSSIDGIGLLRYSGNDRRIKEDNFYVYRWEDLNETKVVDLDSLAVSTGERPADNAVLARPAPREVTIKLEEIEDGLLDELDLRKHLISSDFRKFRTKIMGYNTQIYTNPNDPEFFKVTSQETGISEISILTYLSQNNVPGIPQIEDWGTIDRGRIWIKMKGIRNARTILRPREIHWLDFTKEWRQLTDIERIEKIAGFAEIVLAAHNVGISTNDLKPEHLFFNSDGDLIVFDWGAASAFGGAPRYGTQGYYPKDTRITDQWDVWSLQMIMNNVLPAARSLDLIVKKALEDLQDKIMEHDNPELRPSLEEFVMILRGIVPKPATDQAMTVQDLKIKLWGIITNAILGGLGIDATETIKFAQEYGPYFSDIRATLINIIFIILQSINWSRSNSFEMKEYPAQVGETLNKIALNIFKDTNERITPDLLRIYNGSLKGIRNNVKLKNKIKIQYWVPLKAKIETSDTVDLNPGWLMPISSPISSTSNPAMKTVGPNRGGIDLTAKRMNLEVDTDKCCCEPAIGSKSTGKY